MNIGNNKSEVNDHSAPTQKKHQFSVSEDLQIIQFVNRVTKQNLNNCNLGTSKNSGQSIKWNVIAMKLGRSAKQVRERWNGHLNPSINKGPWSRDEDVLIAMKQREFGNKWAEIAKFFPGRTDTMVKNRWNTSVKNRINELLGPIPYLSHENQKYFQPFISNNYSNNYLNNNIYDNCSTINGYSSTSNSVPSSPPAPSSTKPTASAKSPIAQDSFEEWLDQIKQRKFVTMSFLDFQEVPPLVQH